MKPMVNEHPHHDFEFGMLAWFIAFLANFMEIICNEAVTHIGELVLKCFIYPIIATLTAVVTKKVYELYIEPFLFPKPKRK